MTLKRNTGRELTGKREWVVLIHACSEPRAEKVEAKLAQMSGKEVSELFSLISKDERTSVLRSSHCLPHHGRFESTREVHEYQMKRREFIAEELFNIIEDYLF